MDAVGTNSCSIPSSLAARGTTVKTIPVILPPGRLRLATKPTLNRIGPDDEYDGRRRGCRFARLRRIGAGPYDRGHLPTNEISRQSR